MKVSCRLRVSIIKENIPTSMASSLNNDRKISIAKMRDDEIFFISKLEIFNFKQCRNAFLIEFLPSDNKDQIMEVTKGHRITAS